MPTLAHRHDTTPFDQGLTKIINETLHWVESTVVHRGLTRMINETLHWVENKNVIGHVIMVVNETLHWVENIVKHTAPLANLSTIFVNLFTTKTSVNAEVKNT